MLKVNDVVEMYMSIDLKNFPDEIDCFDPTDYERSYNISYFLNDKIICDVSFDTESGLINSFNDDIGDYLKEDLSLDFKDIAGYEVLELNTNEYENQSAKIKITAIK